MVGRPSGKASELIDSAVRSFGGLDEAVAQHRCCEMENALLQRFVQRREQALGQCGSPQRAGHCEEEGGIRYRPFYSEHTECKLGESRRILCVVACSLRSALEIRGGTKEVILAVGASSLDLGFAGPDALWFGTRG